MQYRDLGASGIRVSRLCFGSLTLGPLCASLPLAEGAALLSAAFAQGVNFVDTAEQYQTYPYIRAALAGLPPEDAARIIIASKTFAETDIQAAWAVEDARLALNRNRLDIMLLHEVRDDADFASRRGAWQLLQQMKQNGLIRAIGISTHSAAMAAQAAELPEVDIIHAMFNQAAIGILDGGLPEMRAAFCLAKANGKGVYSMKALAGGALMHQAKDALLWAFSQPDVDAVAVGCRDYAELVTNLGWLAGEEPTEAAVIKHIDRNMVFDKEPRCHGCGRCVERCAAGALRLGPDGQAEWEKSSCLYCGYCIAACPWFCLSFC